MRSRFDLADVCFCDVRALGEGTTSGSDVTDQHSFADRSIKAKMSRVLSCRHRKLRACRGWTDRRRVSQTAAGNYDLIKCLPLALNAITIRSQQPLLLTH